MKICLKARKMLCQGKAKQERVSPRKMVKFALSSIGLKFTKNVSLDVKPSLKKFLGRPPPSHPYSNNMTVNDYNSKIHTFEMEGSKILKFSYKIVNEQAYR